SVGYFTNPGTATAGTDFLAVNSGTLTFAPGETSKVINITVYGNTVCEPNEAFTVSLYNNVNVTFADNNGTGTIVNDDVYNVPTINVADVSMNEGNSGSAMMNFVVSLTFAPPQAVTVDYITSGGTSPGRATSGSDFQQ